MEENNIWNVDCVTSNSKCKPQNLVLTGEFPDCDVKLCDFGISRYLSQGADVREILGTPDYVAPEVLNYEPISLATDMCKRLSAKECLQHPWFTETMDLLKTPLASAINTNKPTKPRTPVPSKKPIPATEECAAEDNEPYIAPPKTQFPEKTVKDTVNVTPKCNSETGSDDGSNIRGLSAERRKSFMKNMEDLMERLNDKPQEKKVETSEVTLRLKDSKTSERTRLAQVDSFRSMTRASGMQTMPVSGLLRYRLERSCNLLTNGQNSVFHNGNIERDSVFKFRRVFILDDSEDPSPPPSINGSLNSETSMSDSNSDTVSEMSIDSSSDRSSVISLDDSLDLAYSKSLTRILS